MPWFDPPRDAPLPIDPAVSQVLPDQLCRDHLIAPLCDDRSTLELAIVSPDSLLLADEVRDLTDRKMRPMFTTRSVVQRLLSVLDQDQPGINAAASPKNSVHEEVEHELDGRGIPFIKRICERALWTGASDIHIEPYEDSCRVRLRIGGELTEHTPPPMPVLKSEIRQLEKLSNMDIADQRLPQDGVFGLCRDRLRVDMRVNICPMVFGKRS